MTRVDELLLGVAMALGALLGALLVGADAARAALLGAVRRGA